MKVTTTSMHCRTIKTMYVHERAEGAVLCSDTVGLAGRTMGTDELTWLPNLESYSYHYDL